MEELLGMDECQGVSLIETLPRMRASIVLGGRCKGTDRDRFVKVLWLVSTTERFGPGRLSRSR